MINLAKKKSDETIRDSRVVDIFEHPINEGIFDNLSNSDYHAIDGISSTQFKDMELSIAIFQNRHIFRYDCEAFKTGNLIHTALLEPHLLDEFIECSSATLNTIEAKKTIENNPDKIVVPFGGIEIAKEIAKKVMLIYGKYILNSKKETSVIYYNENTKLLHKCRPDIWLDSLGIVLDLKSSKETDHAGFEGTIEKYNYHVSAAWYMDTINETIKKLKLNIPLVTQFGWIVAPKSAPHKPFAFICSAELIEKGREKYQKLLEKYISVRDGGKDELFKEAHSWSFKKSFNEEN